MHPVHHTHEEFCVTSYRNPPTIRVREGSRSVTGLVERPITLTYDRLLTKPTV
jgi:DMSO/TMAO reductase YedYZ molybdopterin-dependent catalytic subunit